MSSEADTAPHPQAARGPGVPGGPGHRPDRHRQGGRRGAARAPPPGASPRARSPTASAACSGSARRSSRPTGARDDIWIIAELARRLGTDWGNPTPEDLWNELRDALADAPRHELREARAARRRPVALPGRGVGRHPVPARPAVGGGPGQARRARPVPPDGAGRPARHAHRRVPDQAHHRPPPRLLQHRRGDQPVTAPRCGGRRRSTCRPRTRRELGLADDEIAGSPRGAARSSPGARGRDAAGRAGVHDAALPRPGGDEHPHARHLGPEVGHRGVQGDRDPGGAGHPTRQPPRPASAEHPEVVS